MDTKKIEVHNLGFDIGETMPVHVLQPDGTYSCYHILVDRKDELVRELIAIGARQLPGDEAKILREQFAALGVLMD